MKRLTIARSSAALAVLSLCTTLAGAQEKPVGDGGTEMLTTGRYQLVVGGERDEDAVFYLTRVGPPQLLVVSEKLAGPVLFTSKDRRAAAVATERLVRGGEDVDLIVLKSDQGETASAPMKLEGRNIIARVGGASLTIEPRDAMVGEIETEKLLSEFPEYRRNSVAYEPALGDVKALAAVETATEFDVFFGSWCPHCEKVIPRLIRVIEEIDNPKLSFRFRGLPKQFADDPLARQFRVTGLPTIVMKRGDEEVGRLEGRMLHAPESALTTALTGLAEGLY